MQRFNVKTFAQAPKPVKLGGIYFFGTPRLHERELRSCMTHCDKYRREVVWNTADPFGSEPAWVSSLPLRTQQYLRISHTIQGAEPLSIVAQAPLLGFGYVVEADSLLDDAVSATGVWRLHHVRQLSFLHAPLACSGNVTHFVVPYTHTRLYHSVMTAAIMTLLVKNNKELLNAEPLLQIAAITHDALTPAGGDCVKSIDPIGFDEDANYASLFKREGWRGFQKKYEVCEDSLFRAVQGKGLLGKVLDFADKLSYLSVDLHHALSYSLSDDAEDALRRISQDFRTDTLFHLWEDVSVQDGEMFLTNPDRLGDFLLVRALMFRHLYYNPDCRLAGYILGGVVARGMFVRGLLTRAWLLEHGDDLLMDKLNEYMGCWLFDPLFSLTGYNLQLFAEKEDGVRYARSLEGDPDTLVLLEHCAPPPTSNALRRFPVLVKGTLTTFDCFDPQKAGKIAEVMSMRERTRVYCIRRDSFTVPDRAWVLLKEFAREVYEL